MKTSLSSPVVLVNESDQELGQASLVEAHQTPGQLHRACSVFVFQFPEQRPAKDVQLLLQKRSAKKLTAPLTWANTVCGHLRPGETYLACAQRRLRDEIGLVGVELKPVRKFSYQVELAGGFVEKELDQVYLGFWNGGIDSLKLNSQEVEQAELADWSELLSEAEHNQPLGLKLSPWFQHFLQHQPLLEKINQLILEIAHE